MSNTPHTLHEEFPGEIDKIHALKTTDAHFARLLQEYDAANDAVHRAETRVDVVSSEHESELRKKRSRLKDDIARALRA
jgi:uncharacterized protein YdcH (DUF465 family)